MRNGSVVDLQVAPGSVTALVSGSTMYDVKVTVAPVPRTRWSALCKDCAGAIDSLVELLQGKLSKSVMARMCQPKTGLFPSPKEITFACSCPGWASMCKHIAAVLYGVGARLDEQPELLFLLRKVNQHDLVAKADSDLSRTRNVRAGKVLDAGDLGDLRNGDGKQRHAGTNGSGPIRTKVTLTGGGALDGFVLNRSSNDLQLLGDDRKIHLLRQSGQQYCIVTSQADWPSYNGQSTGSRYSPLAQIRRNTAARMAPKWIFSLPKRRAETNFIVTHMLLYGSCRYVERQMVQRHRRIPQSTGDRGTGCTWRRMETRSSCCMEAAPRRASRRTLNAHWQCTLSTRRGRRLPRNHARSTRGRGGNEDGTHS